MPLWVTGHSLGGAMATLASVRLTDEGYKVRAVYTYGSPRVGDRVFRDSYRLANYRFVNDNDLVPHLPFRWCYKHVGKLRLVNSEGDFTEEQAAWVAKKRALADKAKRVQRHIAARPAFFTSSAISTGWPITISTDTWAPLGSSFRRRQTEGGWTSLVAICTMFHHVHIGSTRPRQGFHSRTENAVAAGSW